MEDTKKVPTLKDTEILLISENLCIYIIKRMH